MLSALADQCMLDSKPNSSGNKNPHFRSPHRTVVKRAAPKLTAMRRAQAWRHPAIRCQSSARSSTYPQWSARCTRTEWCDNWTPSLAPAENCWVSNQIIAVSLQKSSPASTQASRMNQTSTNKRWWLVLKTTRVTTRPKMTKKSK